MKNFVITRFSLRVRGWAEKAFGDEAKRDDWFAYRAALLRHGLFESLKAQTHKADYLFLFMDPGDTELYERHFKWAEDWVRPIYMRPGQDGNQMIVDTLEDSELSNVVLSRVDSDDLLSVNYIESINHTITSALAEGRDFEYVVARNGYITDLQYLQTIAWKTPPFINLYLDRFAAENIYALNHSKLPVEDCIFSEDAYWMQIVHGSNVLNDFKKVGKSDKFTRSEPVPLNAISWPDEFIPVVDDFRELATKNAFRT